MVPRQRLDIRWSDLLAAVWFCLTQRSGSGSVDRIRRHFGAAGGTVVALSVRSGFDALLTVLDFPPRSEVLVSAVTIGDMRRIIEQHGLLAVPIDVSHDSLSVNETAVLQAITPRTRAIVVAHLFGSRPALEGVARVAHEHGLLLIEDCAQAFTGDDFRGDPHSDVVCFSFGPIKTATSLGGGVLQFRDSDLRTRVEQVQAGWPSQSSWTFLLRVLKFSLLKFVNGRLVFTLFVTLCRRLRIDYDEFLRRHVRGFSGNDFFQKIRHQPSAPLARLLLRRLQQQEWPSVTARGQRAEFAIAGLPASMSMGWRAHNHSHWVFPAQVDQPAELIAWLRAHGFDATQGTSSMVVVPDGKGGETTPEAVRMMAAVVYLPVATCRHLREVGRLTASIREFSARRSIEGELPARLA